MIEDPARPEVVSGLPLADLLAQLGPAVRVSAAAAGQGRSLDAVQLQGITLDSRAARAGDLWCALPGARTHGARFAQQAADGGAVAALTDPAGQEDCERAGLATLVVEDPRAVMATAAALILGRPAERLRMIGVTGTNGKTSVTTMLHRTLLELGRPSGVIGTSGTFFRDTDGHDHRIATVRTTPESPELHGLLARMAEDGVDTCAMEVSSHALVLHRADEVVFEAAAFTNLTQDHLDFHPSMEDYFQAKASLFLPGRCRHAVICTDDDYGTRLAAMAQERGIPTVTYATLPGRPADHRAEAITFDGFGSRFVLAGPAGARPELRSALPGRHYVANTIAVALLLDAVGIAPSEAADALGRAATVPGRMELVSRAPVRGVVDYSHTEDSLQQALSTLRSLPDVQRILVVMGAGGDRDRTKRPHMGAVAAAGADVVIVTDDNPRSEDPARIRAEVLGGIPADTGAEVLDVGGRREAIDRAAHLARPGDLVLVAGKGAETGQDIGGQVLPFDDRVELRRALAARHPAQDDTTPQEAEEC
ncbi:UDP-N-acetylmuramoyl-L-alanyl-D-glutamate--2,6-diaminopimelate ligase [Brachybacterium sp. EF45031]|nr:UDP-N-acetylmuramoyl-L-alanyl-D-glutamate--2,6-diaminopimelate ligase [Brachybacterium sillae]